MSIVSIGSDAFATQSSFQKEKNAIIKGYTGSAAQTYADKHGNIFVALDAKDPDPSLLGDADNNGIVDSNDIIAVVEYIISGVKPVSKANANADGDGSIDINDIVAIINMIVK